MKKNSLICLFLVILGFLAFISCSERVRSGAKQTTSPPKNNDTTPSDGSGGSSSGGASNNDGISKSAAEQYCAKLNKIGLESPTDSNSNWAQYSGCWYLTKTEFENSSKLPFESTGNFSEDFRMSAMKQTAKEEILVYDYLNPATSGIQLCTGTYSGDSGGINLLLNIVLGPFPVAGPSTSLYLSYTINSADKTLTIAERNSVNNEVKKSTYKRDLDFKIFNYIGNLSTKDKTVADTFQKQVDIEKNSGRVKVPGLDYVTQCPLYSSTPAIDINSVNKSITLQKKLSINEVFEIFNIAEKALQVKK